MNLIKALTAAALTFATTAAMAFTPPYHISDGYIGTATIQSSGSCKLKQTYKEAKYGSIYDSANAYVGAGLLSASGDILALEEDYETLSSVYDSATSNSTNVYFEDYASDDTKQTIEALAGCTINKLISSAKSKETYVNDNKRGKYTYTLVSPFNGISPTLNSVKGTKNIKKAQTFSGKILFKGIGQAI